MKEVAMIKGVHTMFSSSEPEALRAFLRDKRKRSPPTSVSAAHFHNG
jgi:hypothetical protein